MKIFSLLITLIFSLGISAQNWSPINLNVEYNYKTDTAQLITNTILVDSFGLNNNDTTFYLNRIMGDCDTCSTAGYKLINQPQFLMRQVLKKDDSLFVFQDPEEFKIYPLKNLGESWIFDSTNSINATIDSVYTDTLFGITDSLKRINLSNGNNIILSKSFGIVQFPEGPNLNYELIGLKNDSLFGEQVPGFWDFFNYEVNDILQWKYYSYCGGGAHASTTSHFKGAITSKTISGDTATYQVQGIEHNSNYNDFQGTINTTDTFNLTLTYVDSVSHLSNSYINENHTNQVTSLYFANTATKIIEINNLQLKSIDFVNESYWNQPPLSNNDLLVHGSPPPNRKKTTFTVGLGDCRSYSPGISCTEIHCMQGRIHLGDTIGFVYPDSFYVVSIEKINKRNISIYPNPTTETITIDLGKIEQNIKATLTNSIGQVILTQQFETADHFNIDINAPSGIYFLSIESSDGDMKTIKILKN